MKILFVLIVAQTVLTQGVRADDAPGAIRTYDLSPHYFREYYLRENGLPDLPLTLNGEWTDAQVKRLAEILAHLHADRPKRDASIIEWPYHTRLVFRVGDEFAIDRDDEHFQNSAQIWGGGISGITTLTYTVPMGESDEKISASLGPKLPEVLVKDPEVLRLWKADVARAFRGRHGPCAGLFRSILGVRLKFR